MPRGIVSLIIEAQLDSDRIVLVGVRSGREFFNVSAQRARVFHTLITGRRQVDPPLVAVDLADPLDGSRALPEELTVRVRAALPGEEP